MEIAARRTVVLLAPPAREVQIRDLYCSITSKADYYWPPIDLLAVSGVLDGSFGLEVVDAVAEGLPRARALERVLRARPAAVVALSGSSSSSDDMPFLKEIKEKSGCLIVVSGDICVDPSPWPLTAFPWLDALLRDFSAPGLREYLAAEGRWEKPIPGLAFRSGGRIVDGGGKLEGPLSYPLPRHDLFPLRRYRLPHGRRRPFSSVLTHFGCPFTCSYCIQNRNVMGSRHRPLSDVLAELESLRALGVREIYFRDPLFESRPSEAKALCRAMAKDFDFAWSCNCRVDTLDEALLAAMSAAGCRCVAFGLETADERALARYEKATTLEQARRAIALCRRHGVETAGYFILGLPGETFAAALRTIEFAVGSGLDYASFAVPSPDYGTELRAEAIRQGRIEPDFRSFNRSKAEKSLSSELTEADLRALLRRANRSFYGRPSYLAKRLLRIRSLREARESLNSAYALLAC